MIRPLTRVCKFILIVGMSIFLCGKFFAFLLYDELYEFSDTPLRALPRNMSQNLSLIDLYVLDPQSALQLQFQPSPAEPIHSVPKIIHQSWNDYNIPLITEKWVKRWKETNSDYKYMFWTDETSRAFMINYFPQYVAVYDSFELPVQKADLFRYFVLWAIGGVYADIDVEPLKSLEDMRRNHACVLGQEPEAHFRIIHPYFGTEDNNYTLSCNAFMFCRPRHPFMAFLINEILERRKEHKTCSLPETLLCTGPYILSTSWVKYKKVLQKSLHQYPEKYPENDVICPDPNYFLPTWDPLRTGWIRAVCLVRKRFVKLPEYTKNLCNRLRAERFKNRVANYSYTNHHWFHSWTEERSRYLRRRFARKHISLVVPDLLYGGDYAH